MWFCWILVATCASEAWSLRITSISPSQTVTRYSDLTLHCFYQLDNEDRLFQLKWLLDDTEVVRYTPSSSPAVKVFGRSPGYVIDKRHTNGTLVAFHQIDFGAAGQWKCRVTAEAPSFESVEASARLRVVALPSEEPVIVRSQTSFQIGDMLTFTCVSCCSNPPVNLTWILNDDTVGKESIQAQPMATLADGTFNTSSAVRVRAHETHFRDGVLRLRCRASIADADYWRSAEIAVRWPAPHRRNPFAAHKSRGSNGCSSFHSQGCRWSWLPSVYVSSVLLLVTSKLLHHDSVAVLK